MFLDLNRNVEATQKYYNKDAILSKCSTILLFPDYNYFFKVLRLFALGIVAYFSIDAYRTEIDNIYIEKLASRIDPPKIKS